MVSLIGVSMFNEPKEFYKGKPVTAKQVSLIGVSMFNEPKGFYKTKKAKQSSAKKSANNESTKKSKKMMKFVQLQREKWAPHV